MKMQRRTLLSLLVLAPAAALKARAADAGPDTVRGNLVQASGKPPALQIRDGSVTLEGEPETLAVLGDERLAGADMELRGHRLSRDRFRIGPFFESKSMFVHRNGKTYTISYWCEICSIRTYTPGKCMCCQQETHITFQEYPPQ
jgi:hypothetical protein